MQYDGHAVRFKQSKHVYLEHVASRCRDANRLHIAATIQIVIDIVTERSRETLRGPRFVYDVVSFIYDLTSFSESAQLMPKKTVAT